MLHTRRETLVSVAVSIGLGSAYCPADQVDYSDEIQPLLAEHRYACHGPDAKTPILPEYPRLAGQTAPYLLRQMQDIKSGARNNGNTPAMAGVMHLVSQAEMEVLADYLSGLEP